jgi:hypothetical protein
MPGCDACGVSLRRNETIATAAASNSAAARYDAIQVAYNEGPCLDALRTGQRVSVRSLADETRWLYFIAEARDAGVVASLSLPLLVSGDRLGALNLYSRGAAFDPAAERLADPFADQAGLVLFLARAQEKTRQLIVKLHRALESRDLIGTAKGIIMAREGCGLEQAFDVLRSALQARNEKLVDIELALSLIPRCRSRSSSRRKPLDWSHAPIARHPPRRICRAPANLPPQRASQWAQVPGRRIGMKRGAAGTKREHRLFGSARPLRRRREEDPAAPAPRPRPPALRRRTSRASRRQCRSRALQRCLPYDFRPSAGLRPRPACRRRSR